MKQKTTGVNKIEKTHVKIRCFYMAYCKVLTEVSTKRYWQFKEFYTNESTKKMHLRRKKGKHGTGGNELKCQLQ